MNSIPPLSPEAREVCAMLQNLNSELIQLRSDLNGQKVSASLAIEKFKRWKVHARQQIAELIGPAEVMNFQTVLANVRKDAGGTAQLLDSISVYSSYFPALQHHIVEHPNDLTYIAKLRQLPENKMPALKRAFAKKSSPNKVFIVHGHDNEAKQEVARFVETLNLNAVILHEKANEGQTIIEKFEKHSDVAFAIIIMTPDDKGSVKNSETQSPRARQNVIFEHGFFFGRVGRGNVCALYKAGVELPSDLSGVLYTLMDTSGAWKLELAKEMSAAGLSVNINLLLK